MNSSLALVGGPQTFTDPLDPDPDGDGLPDGWEHENGSDPLAVDAGNLDPDGDGLTDSEELSLGTDPRKRDTDGDKLPDGWEAENGFDPLVDNSTDSDPDNDADADPDDDGLLNFDEYLNGSDPSNGDTDGDGARDGTEVAQGSDPADASDNGRPPPPEDILELPFRIYGDWAAWEMTVEGRGPSDLRVFRLSTDAPGGSATVVRKLHRGNSYRLTMSWLGVGEHRDPYWYCWEAKIGGLPAQQAYGNPSSVATAVRIPGAATTVAGEGWFADNPDGLLTAHVHSNDNGSGNVAEGLEAILYVPKIVTETVATSPPDRERKTIGVGEEVNLMLLPAGLGLVSWNIPSGSGQLSHYYSTGSILFTAPGEASDTTVTATFSGGECEVDFDIIEPSSFTFENTSLVPPELHLPTPTEDWMHIHYYADMYLCPDTVNFYNVRLYEGESDPFPVGYFTLYRHGMQKHPSNGPHIMTATVVPGKGTLCVKSDEIMGIVELNHGPIDGFLYWDLLWEFDIPNGIRSILKLIRQNNHIAWGVVGSLFDIRHSRVAERFRSVLMCGHGKATEAPPEG